MATAALAEAANSLNSLGQFGDAGPANATRGSASGPYSQPDCLGRVSASFGPTKRLAALAPSGRITGARFDGFWAGKAHCTICTK